MTVTANEFGFNLLDPATFSKGHPWVTYDRMRAAQPVMRHEGSEVQPPFWLVNNFAMIKAVSTDTHNFTTTKGFRIQSDRRRAMDPKIAQVLSRFMLAMDEPEHSLYRGLVSSGFMPASLRLIEDKIRQSVATMMAGLSSGQIVEFVTEVGAIVPIKTVCAIMGVPEEDEQRVFEFTNAAFGTDDPAFAPTLEVANRNYLEIFDYARWLFEKRREEPRDDLATLLVNARIDRQAARRDRDAQLFLQHDCSRKRNDSKFARWCGLGFGVASRAARSAIGRAKIIVGCSRRVAALVYPRVSHGANGDPRCATG